MLTTPTPKSSNPYHSPPTTKPPTKPSSQTNSSSRLTSSNISSESTAPEAGNTSTTKPFVSLSLCPPPLTSVISNHPSHTSQAIHICAKNIPHLSGRVLVQTSLRHLNDRDAIVKQARALALLFAEHGLPAYRFAIKVPFSGAGAAAAQQLTRDGISVLATAVFSLEQAIAASHAGCAFISPYYNEIAAHLDPSLRPNFEDPALEHPMSPRIIQILETFAKAYKETGKEQPVMVVASHFTNSEILAMTELKCQHITIPPRLLTTLLEAPDTLEPLTSPKKAFSYAEYETAERLAKLSATDPLAGPGWDGKLATLETDYIGHDGARLDTFIKSDPLVSKRLADAEAFFLEMEDKARIAIEKELAAQGF